MKGSAITRCDISGKIAGCHPCNGLGFPFLNKVNFPEILLLSIAVSMLLDLRHMLKTTPLPSGESQGLINMWVLQPALTPG
jgi:GTPase involved in cell partitioning and DNA repair